MDAEESNINSELYRAFPGIYSHQSSSAAAESANDMSDHTPYSLSSGDPFQQIHLGMQSPAVHTALDHGQHPPSARGPTAHNIRLSSPTIPRPYPSATPLTGRSRPAVRGIGITRFLTSGAANVHTPQRSEPTPRPHESTLLTSTAVNESNGNTAATSSGQQYMPYQLPVYNRRASYLPPRIAARRRQSNSRAKPDQFGRWFTKTIVLVDSTDSNIPCGPCRQELHEMGAVVHPVDLFTGWNEGQIREAIEDCLME